MLARRWACPFIDSDATIEARLGCSIRQYFEMEGEDRFRDFEQSVLAALVDECRGKSAPATSAATAPSAVISTGGGIVLRPANRQLLAQQTCVIYLRASAEELYRRLKHDKTRPLLQVSDPLKKLLELYAQREPLYRECSRFVIETGRPTVHALVNMICTQVELSGVLSPHATPDDPEVPGQSLYT
jgi:shikimate kinase